MLLENQKRDKFTLNKYCFPQVSSPIQSIACLSDKVITLDTKKTVRIFSDMKGGNHTAYELSGSAAVYKNILALPLTDYILLYNTEEGRSIGFLGTINFDFQEINNFSSILSVSSEPKSFVIVDNTGAHIYYIGQGYYKLNIFKIGCIQLSKLPNEVKLCPSERYYITKQLYGNLYLLKFIKKTKQNEFHYRIKLFYIPRFYKGHHRKASLSLNQRIADIIPMSPRGLVAILTIDNQLLILNIETQSIIGESNCYGNIRPYKIMSIGQKAEIVVFETKRTMVIDVADSWKTVFESRADQETSDKLVNEVVVDDDGKIVFNEGSKICVLRSTYSRTN